MENVQQENIPNKEDCDVAAQDQSKDDLTPHKQVDDSASKSSEENLNLESENQNEIEKRLKTDNQGTEKNQENVENGVGQVGEGTSETQEEGEYMIPQKEILMPDEISTVWEKSQAYADLLGFIMAMSDAIKGKKLSDDYSVSSTIENLVKVLETLDKYIDEIPPIDQPQRFGNTAYRDWFSRMEQNCEQLVRESLPEQCHAAVPEISVYLRESLGNSTRIDYGTGHEIAFVAFLCCLYKVGALTETDAVATVFSLFHRYVELARRLHTVYRMEPAGSQGVWNLDDYSFVPFIWGAAQLIEHQRLKPKHYPDPEMCLTFAKDYMLFSAVLYIHKVKTGPFHEHSNQLWNISGVKLWTKVHGGLIKMYKAEVLSKFPVIQHFLFGSLMSVEPVDS